MAPNYIINARKKACSRLFLLTCFGALGATFSSCQHQKVQSTVSQGAEVKLQTLDRPKIVFNWSADEVSLKQHLWNQSGDALNMNKGIASLDSLPQLGQQGYGLYVAMDPFVSTSFGNQLSCVSIKPDVTWVDAELSGGPSPLDVIRSPVQMIVYNWGMSYWDGKEKSAVSAVIRDPRIVDLGQSSRFSMKLFGEGNGLPPALIAQARQDLQSGNWCRALSVFKDQYDNFAMAFLNAQEVQNQALNTVLISAWLIGARSSENARLSNAITKITANSQLTQDLVAAQFLKSPEPPRNRILVSTLFMPTLFGAQNVVDKELAPDQQAARIALIVRTFNETGIWKIESNPQTVASLDAAITSANQQMLSSWGASHPEDVSLAKDMMKAIEGRTLKGMSAQFGM